MTLSRDEELRDILETFDCTGDFSTAISQINQLFSIVDANKTMGKDEISQCSNCLCMTKTIKGKCGKCKKDKGKDKEVEKNQKKSRNRNTQDETEKRKESNEDRGNDGWDEGSVSYEDDFF